MGLTTAEKQTRKEATASERSCANELKSAYETASDVPRGAANLEDKEFIKEICSVLQRHKWYHGLMPRDEIEEMLVKDGDFIVRRTEVNKRTRFVVSLRNRAKVRHVLIKLCDDGQWRLYSIKSPSLADLIEKHVQQKLPVLPDGTILEHPVKRPNYYLLHENIIVSKKIGGGAFGDVYIGKLKKSNGKHVDAAIKMLKGVMTKNERCNFMKEAKIMRRFHHTNIVNLLGVAVQEYPVMIVLELCPNGALNAKLKSDPKVPEEKLVQYTIDTCRGMVYLSEKMVIHRDIAARNCLLGKHDEAKISDFGLSVADKGTISFKKLRQVPVRWLAPETLRKGQFSTKTDVWSFGVLIWEIFTRCRSDPYPGLTNAEVRVKVLSSKIPMELPDGAPKAIDAVMNKCFTQDPSKRPTFAELFKMLEPQNKTQKQIESQKSTTDISGSKDYIIGESPETTQMSTYMSPAEQLGKAKV